MFLAVMLAFLGAVSAQECELRGFVPDARCAAFEQDAFACCPGDEMRARWIAEAIDEQRQRTAMSQQVRQQYRDQMVQIPHGEFSMGCTPGQGAPCCADDVQEGLGLFDLVVGNQDSEADGQRAECDSGDKSPHTVRLTRALHMGRTEVTQELYEVVMGSNPSRFTDCGADCPVENVSWYEAVAFSNALSEQLGLPQCYHINDTTVTMPNGLHCGGFRLPTETEWEVAARGGEDRMYSGADNLDSVAWHGGNGNGTTHPVAQKRPNGYELYDMSGNVAEWVWDTYGSYLGDAFVTGLVDPARFDEQARALPSHGADFVVVARHHVLRGGSWLDGENPAKVSERSPIRPNTRQNSHGFRVVLADPSDANVASVEDAAPSCELAGFVEEDTCPAAARDATGCCPSEALRLQWASAAIEEERRRISTARMSQYREQMVRIASGTYVIGCTTGQGEGCPEDVPAHEVTLGQSFHMGRTEVTQGLYLAVTGTNPSRFADSGPDWPVDGVTWYDAVFFANALSEQLGLPQCYHINDTTVTMPNGPHCGGFRLPTETEWEVAARGGEDRMFSGADTVDAVAWSRDNSGSATHPVAQKQANGYGLYDMSGNVAEWVWDSSGGTTHRVHRGGSWDSRDGVMHLSRRDRDDPHNHYPFLGFRLVLAASSAQ